MIRAAADLFKGELIDEAKVPDGLAEHMFASEYGWELPIIRALPPADFRQHLGILLVKYRLESMKSGL